MARVRLLGLCLLGFCVWSAHGFTIHPYGSKPRIRSTSESQPPTQEQPRSLQAVGGGLALVSTWALLVDRTGHHAGVTSPAHLTVCIFVALYILFSPSGSSSDRRMQEADTRHVQEQRRGSDIRMTSEETTEYETKCYLVDGIVMDGQDLILCTSEPEEAAWDWGVHPSAMKETNADLLQCEETLSTSGTPEWLCTSPHELTK